MAPSEAEMRKQAKEEHPGLTQGGRPECPPPLLQHSASPSHPHAHAAVHTESRRLQENSGATAVKDMAVLEKTGPS